MKTLLLACCMVGCAVGQTPQPFPDTWVGNIDSVDRWTRQQPFPLVHIGSSSEELCVGRTIWNGTAAVLDQHCVKLHEAPTLLAQIPDRIPEPTCNAVCQNEKYYPNYGLVGEYIEKGSQPVNEPVVQEMHHCTLVGDSANSPHLFDRSEIYQCDEGKIEIAGQEKETIEYGYVYSSELGRVSRERPHKATADDYKNSKWCPTPEPWDPNQKERCGDKPGKCWDGKLGTWDSDWQGYSCVTPDHGMQAPLSLAQIPDRIQYPTTIPSGVSAIATTKAEVFHFSYPDQPEPMDVPAVEKGGYLGFDCDPGNACVDHWITTWTCADVSRVLLTSEDGKKHCLKFQ